MMFFSTKVNFAYYGVINHILSTLRRFCDTVNTVLDEKEGNKGGTHQHDKALWKHGEQQDEET